MRIGGEIISTEEPKRDLDDVNVKIARSWESDRKMARMKKNTRRPNKPTIIQDRE